MSEFKDISVQEGSGGYTVTILPADGAYVRYPKVVAVPSAVGMLMQIAKEDSERQNARLEILEQVYGERLKTLETELAAFLSERKARKVAL